MKKLLKTLLFGAALTACTAGFSPAFARQGDISAEISGDVATEPAGNLGATAGFTVGGGYEIVNDLQLRADLSYYRWTDNGFDYDRVPLVFGARKYFPTSLHDLKVFGQGGLEVSFDDVPVAPGVTSSETNAGVNLGGGVEYAIAPRFSIGSDLRFHFIKDWYTTVGFGLGYHF